MTQLYEIRHSDTGWKLLANATARQVSKFWQENKPTESRTQKIDGVIVIYVKTTGSEHDAPPSQPQRLAGPA